MQPRIEVIKIRPWWLRLALLTLIASPMFLPSGMHTSLHADQLFSDFATWMGYAVFLWLFIGLCVGLERLLVWLSAATVFGLALAFGGACVAKLGIWSWLNSVLGDLSGSTGTTLIEHQSDLIFRLFIVMTSLPFFFLVVNSFPATDIFLSAVRHGTRGRAKFFVVVAVFLRLFQYVFEVFTSLWLAWREENPEKILPRHRLEFHRFRWAMDSLLAWCAALLVHSLIFVPTVVRDWEPFFTSSGEV